MEPLFQVETAHDADAYRHMVTVHYMLHQKNPVWALYALAVVLALFIWWMAAAGNYTSLSALGTGVFCLALFLLAVPYVDRSAAKRVCHRMEKQVVKAAKKNDAYAKPIRYRFFEDHLDAADSAGSSETPYGQITDLVEDEPDRVEVPVKMHIGAPSVPVVKAGDTVEAGQLIAQCPENALGAQIHAPIAGTVREVGARIVIEKGSR